MVDPTWPLPTGFLMVPELLLTEYQGHCEYEYEYNLTHNYITAQIFLSEH